MAKISDVRAVLHAGVEAVGGEDRPGQIEMAEAVAKALRDGEHLLIQAGTGTGKSLGYLVPALLHDKRVVIATATLNLQHQLVERDIPALKEAAKATLGEAPHHAVVKGRGNYACLHRIREGVPDEQGALIEVPEGSLGEEVLTLRAWAEDQSESHGVGDRDSAPSHTERAWRQISVTARECLGALKCRYGQECFAERARDDATDAHIIVTNHALLAIDAIDGVPMLPDYDAVVVDEAHELAARVTQASTNELSVPTIERAGRRARNAVDGKEADDVVDAADALADVLAATEQGRIDLLSDELFDALAWSGMRQGRAGQRSRRRTPKPSPMRPGSRRAVWSTTYARPPTEWPPISRLTFCGSPRPGAASNCASLPSTCPPACATSCSARRP